MLDRSRKWTFNFKVNFPYTDTVEERNKLTKEVFPDLRRYCQSRGVDFEVVDMRWGVRDTATSDHLTSELCLREIDHCKRLSLGPSFVVSVHDDTIMCPTK